MLKRMLPLYQKLVIIFDSKTKPPKQIVKTKTFFTLRTIPFANKFPI